MSTSPLYALACAASDHVTRILKEYGDVLDKYQLAPERSDVGRELRVLRCLLLLIKLTGLSLPQGRLL